MLWIDAAIHKLTEQVRGANAAAPMIRSARVALTSTSPVWVVSKNSGLWRNPERGGFNAVGDKALAGIGPV